MAMLGCFGFLPLLLLLAGMGVIPLGQEHGLQPARVLVAALRWILQGGWIWLVIETRCRREGWEAWLSCPVPMIH